MVFSKPARVNKKRHFILLRILGLWKETLSLLLRLLQTHSSSQGVFRKLAPACHQRRRNDYGKAAVRPLLPAPSEAAGGGDGSSGCLLLAADPAVAGARRWWKEAAPSSGRPLLISAHGARAWRWPRPRGRQDPSRGECLQPGTEPGPQLSSWCGLRVGAQLGARPQAAAGWKGQTTEMVWGELGKRLAGGTTPPSAVGAQQQGGFRGAPHVSSWVFR